MAGTNHTINLENRLEGLQFKVENLTADTNKTKQNISEETKAVIAEIKKNIGKILKILSNDKSRIFKK